MKIYNIYRSGSSRLPSPHFRFSLISWCSNYTPLSWRAAGRGPGDNRPALVSTPALSPLPCTPPPPSCLPPPSPSPPCTSPLPTPPTACPLPPPPLGPPLSVAALTPPPGSSTTTSKLYTSLATDGATIRASSGARSQNSVARKKTQAWVAPGQARVLDAGAHIHRTHMAPDLLDDRAPDASVLVGWAHRL
uniref:Uncharacterized protein n=2 Tax=Anthurium amnicola TaxID=1678845 RepID=A0A1D1Z4T3_9ARAE